MSTFLKKFGDTIKKYRKLRGYSQERLAGLANMDFKYLGEVERGQRNISVKNVEKICNALDVQPYQIFMFEIKGNTKAKIGAIIDSLDDNSKAAIITLLETLQQTK